VKRIELLDRLLADEDLASPVYGSAGGDIDDVHPPGDQTSRIQ
jgi:hypothetical protein